LEQEAGREEESGVTMSGSMGGGWGSEITHDGLRP
jgi:hypothetical protein